MMVKQEGSSVGGEKWPGARYIVTVGHEAEEPVRTLEILA